MVPVFNGSVSLDGKLSLDVAERGLRAGYLKRLAGKPVEIVIKKLQSKRSQQQNRWHFGVAIPILAAEFGYDRHESEALHYALVAKCFGTRLDAKLGIEVPNVRSSKLTTAQFSELMEWEVRFAATEYGIVVPLPGEAAA